MTTLHRPTKLLCVGKRYRCPECGRPHLITVSVDGGAIGGNRFEDIECGEGPQAAREALKRLVTPVVAS